MRMGLPAHMKRAVATSFAALALAWHAGTLALNGLDTGTGGPAASTTATNLAEGSASAADLLKLCGSGEADLKAYCDGFLSGAMDLWKYATACSSKSQSDRSYCAGGDAAGKKIQQAIEACTDCDFVKFRPDLKDDPLRGQLFVDRRLKFLEELKASLGVCTVDARRDADFCSGYGMEAAHAVASFPDATRGAAATGRDARELGFAHATQAVAAEMYVSPAFHLIRPCLQRTYGPEKARGALQDFAHDYPEQVPGSRPMEFLLRALYYGVCPGPAHRLRPHMEQCTNWGSDGTANTCDKPVFVEYVLLGHSEVERRQLDPGESIRSGQAQMFATCPAGYISAPEVSPENREIIVASAYSCISATDPLVVAYKRLAAEGEATCRDPDLKPYFDKTPCLATDITPVQTANASTISEPQRTALQKKQAARSRQIRAFVEGLRQHGGDEGAALASLLEEHAARDDANALALSSGTITWGEYNRRRKELADQFQEKVSQPEDPMGR